MVINTDSFPLLARSPPRRLATGVAVALSLMARASH
jgi:hypothetical protein